MCVLGSGYESSTCPNADGVYMVCGMQCGYALAIAVVCEIACMLKEPIDAQASVAIQGLAMSYERNYANYA